MTGKTVSPITSIRQTDPYKGLLQISCIINSIHDYRQLLTSILGTTKEFMYCEAASIMLYHEETNDLAWHVALGAKAEKLKEMGRLKMGQGIAGWVAENRQSALVEDASKDSRFFKGADSKTGFQTRSVVCAPLTVQDKLVGVLQALNPIDGKSFNQRDLEIFEAYGAMAATAIEKIRWEEATLQQQKYQQELEIAQDIQARFLTQEFPFLSGSMDLAFFSEPAFHVGGDFYDVQKTKDGNILMILGDVSGKGVPAALLMAQILSEFRFRASVTSCPAETLSGLNSCLSSRSARGMFATAWCASVQITPAGLQVSHSSAGHLPPIHVTPEGANGLELVSGFPLGLMPESEYTPTPLTLRKQEFLFNYTDGVTEGRDPQGNEFGSDRLLETLLSLRHKGVMQNIQKDFLDALRIFSGTAPQKDDLTFLLFGPV